MFWELQRRASVGDREAGGRLRLVLARVQLVLQVAIIQLVDEVVRGARLEAVGPGRRPEEDRRALEQRPPRPPALPHGEGVRVRVDAEHLQVRLRVRRVHNEL